MQLFGEALDPYAAQGPRPAVEVPGCSELRHGRLRDGRVRRSPDDPGRELAACDAESHQRGEDRSEDGGERDVRTFAGIGCAG